MTKVTFCQILFLLLTFILTLKGDAAAPKCGFSRQTIDLLNGLDAEYGTFDILADESVRQELKTFSNWPTYPQVINKELIKNRVYH